MILDLTSQVRIERIGEENDLDALRDDWNRLAGDISFRRFEWLTTWWRHYREPDWELFVLAVRDQDDALIGLMPLYRSRSVREGRVLRFLGSGEVCSDYLTLLAVPSVKYEVASAVVAWLAERGRDWDMLELVGLDASDPIITTFARRFRATGYIIDSRPGENCWLLELPATWEDYLQSLSKSRRANVRRLLRRSFETGRVTNGVVDGPDAFEFYFQRLEELHHKRRMSLGERGCFASSKFTSFHHDVMQQMLSLGLLRLWWTNLDGCPAAIEYALVGGDTIYFYQSGIEPALAKEHPGWLSTIGSLQYAYKQGFRYFDFLRGDEAYKSSWGATPRQATELRIVAPRLIPRLRYCVWRTRKILGRIKRALRIHKVGFRWNSNQGSTRSRHRIHGRRRLRKAA